MSPKAAYKGDILTEEDLRGIDIGRLLRLGAIGVCVDQCSAQAEAEKPSDQTVSEPAEVPLCRRSRGDLNTIAAKLGIESPKVMANRDAVIEAIKTAQAEAEAEAE